MMSQPLCYFLIQNGEISGSSMSNNDFGAIKSLIAEFYVLKKIAQAQCLGSILRLNVQAQYSGSMSKFFCAKKMLRLNVQAQCLSLMRLIYLAYFR